MSEARQPGTAELLATFQLQIKTCELMIAALQEKLLAAQDQLTAHQRALFQGNGAPAIQTTLRLMETSLRHVEATLLSLPPMQTAVHTLEISARLTESTLAGVKTTLDTLVAWHERVHQSMDAPRLERLKAMGAAQVAMISGGASILVVLLTALLTWLLAGKAPIKP